MLKSCKYCGRVHDNQYICQQKEANIRERQSRRSRENKKIYDFPRSQKWTDKSISIRARDQYCCQVCIRKLYGAERLYETEDISVHHIRPLSEAWEDRLDDYNLISLCRMHHEMADKGEIGQRELLKIAEEQEGKDDSLVCG